MSSSTTATPESGRRRRPTLTVGDERVVEVLRIAHGGHAIAHADGSTLLVRHALPGETVRIRVTEVDRRVVRADAIEVLIASTDRVEPPCALSRPGGCGGCDFQHVALPRQRQLKAEVLVDALRRFGGVDGEVLDGIEAIELPGAADGLHWRTRMQWIVTADGSLGLHRARSHVVIPVGECLIAAPGLQPRELAEFAVGAVVGESVMAAVGSDGRVAVSARHPSAGTPGRVIQQIGERSWRIAPSSFWQVHPGLPAALMDAVLALGDPRPGEHWWDLYAGAGLLASGVADAVGATGRVDAVEASSISVKEGRRALHDSPTITLHEAQVDRWLREPRPRPSGVVLDPPRAGAGREVLERLVDSGVERLVYVACDPVALGRDVGILRDRGYRLAAVRAFDAFPMTHHVEAVALLRRSEDPTRGESAGVDQIS